MGGISIKLFPVPAILMKHFTVRMQSTETEAYL